MPEAESFEQHELNERPLLIHIGYCKAGSTWLQRTIFDERIGFCTPWGRKVGEAIEQFVVVPNSFRFDGKAVFRRFSDGLGEAAARDLVPVMSEESLVGDQMAQKYWTREVADRIRAVFPKARILMCIREQRSMILSSYRQYIRSGGTHDLRSFLGSGDPRPPGVGAICRSDFLEYDLAISYYQRIFGGRNVLVLPCEWLRYKRDLFLRMLLGFAGIQGLHEDDSPPQRVGARGGTVKIRRHLNTLAPPHSALRRSHRITAIELLCWLLDRCIPRRIHQCADASFRRVIDDVVGDYYRDSNSRTSGLIDIDLADCGYDCSSVASAQAGAV